MKKKLWRWPVRILLLFILYLCLGCLLPFIHQKEVSPEFIESWNPEDVYSDGSPCPDRASIIETSMDALNSRLQLIHQAQSSIILSTFDIRPGQSTDDIVSALLEAADRDVQVQILVDGLYGSLHMGGEAIFYALGSHPNVEIRFYNIPNPLAPWNIHGRMHDKYLIADDQLLILGGRNTFDYFLGEYQEQNLSYDRDVLVYNTAPGSSSQSVISDTIRYFQDMWDSPLCSAVFQAPSRAMSRKLPAARQELKDHYQQLAAQSPELTEPGIDYHSKTVPVLKATLISNPTHALGKEPWVWYQVQDLMRHADERIYIHTPYAVFSRDMYDDMTAIAGQTDDFTMLVNSTAVGDNVMASSDYTHNRNNIIQTGVTLYEFYGDHSSHGKSILIDDDLSIIGSYNLDMRSTYVDTETMLVLHSPQLNQQLEEHLQALEKDSLLIASDGALLPEASNPPIRLSKRKEAMFAITSRLFQLIRYLI